MSGLGRLIGLILKDIPAQMAGMSARPVREPDAAAHLPFTRHVLELDPRRASRYASRVLGNLYVMIEPRSGQYGVRPPTPSACLRRRDSANAGGGDA